MKRFLIRLTPLMGIFVIAAITVPVDACAGGDGRLLENEGGEDRSGKPISVAVKALDWMKDKQIKTGKHRGAWEIEPKDDVHYTASAGLGLLAFLAHGETPDSKQYGETVEMAIEYLIENQKETEPPGAFCELERQGVYAHGIATYAVATAYGITRKPDLKKAVDNAAEVIVAGQQLGGGWNYGYAKGGRRDTSIACWQILALRAAYMAGSKISGLKEAMNRAAVDLERSYLPGKKQFSYTTDVAAAATTPIGACCLQLLKADRSDEAVAAMENLQDEGCSWQTESPFAMYRWYFVTRAMRNSGGTAWSQWANRYITVYVDNQFEDGHWESPSTQDNRYGPAYTTSLGVLTLEAPYGSRWPSFRAPVPEKIEPSDDEAEEIEIEIDIL